MIHKVNKQIRTESQIYINDLIYIWIRNDDNSSELIKIQRNIIKCVHQNKVGT